MHPGHFDPASALRRRRNGRRLFGTFLLTGGIFMLLSILHVIPTVVGGIRITGPVILLVLGIFLTIHHRLRNPLGPLLVVVGIARLIPPFHIINGVYSNRLIWPLIIIGSGLYFLLRKKGFERRRRFRDYHQGGAQWSAPQKADPLYNSSDRVTIDVTFGGTREVVTSRNFKGGSVSSTFGGVDLNLMQAAIGPDPAVLEIRAMFSGVEIVVPSDWDVQNDIQPVMGSVEDHRYIRPAAESANRQLLILRGSCTFGSVEIKSY